MHGGISPEIQRIEEINQIDRFTEVPLQGAFCDLLWADPMKDDQAIRGQFDQNKERDCSVYFGKKPLTQMLQANQLVSIIRGHQVQLDGYKMHKWDGPQSFPMAITVFSAPNYCGYYENKAAVIVLEDGGMLLKQYDETSPPYRLPDNMDLFSWSIPFLVEKVVSMFYGLIEKL